MYFAAVFATSPVAGTAASPLWDLSVHGGVRIDWVFAILVAISLAAVVLWWRGQKGAGTRR